MLYEYTFYVKYITKVIMEAAVVLEMKANII